MDKPGMNPQMGMEMMKKMMGGGEGGPMQMCKEMLAALQKTTALAAFATPELQGLFGDWLSGKEEAVADLLYDGNSHDAADLARRLELSEESTVYLLARLAVEGKVHLFAQSVLPDDVGATASKATPTRKKSSRKDKGHKKGL